jgi:hypothetical protein
LAELVDGAVDRRNAPGDELGARPDPVDATD